ncbi:MAG: YoaK family protein [Eubacteriales bacterium]|nr:YoaK family protein [Eubacteriales bacterium]
MSESMLLGALLAVVGGFLDVYTYLCRGGVFANAQTGNIVLFGLYLAEREWLTALRYLPPILAFAAGVVAAEELRRRYQNRQSIHWRQVVVLVQATLLCALAFAPQSLNTAVNVVISFVCALQVEAFRKLRGSAFATTMCTGNLRSGTEQLVIWRREGDAKAGRKAARYYAIILFFIGGAVLGGALTDAFDEKAVFAACALLLVIFGMMFIEEEEQKERP